MRKDWFNFRNNHKWDYRNPVMFADAGGTGDKKVEISEKELNEMREAMKQIPTLTASITQLKKDNETATAKIVEYEGFIGSEDGIKQLLAKKGGSATPSQTPEVNLDELSNSQLVDYVLKQVKASLDTHAQNLQKTLEDFDGRVSLGFAKADTQLSALRHHPKLEEPGYDFMSLKDDIQKVLEKNPAYSTEKAYQEVVKDRKLQEQERLTKEKADAEAKKDSFTEKGEVPETLIKDKDLDGSAATRKAMELVGNPPK